MSFICDTCVPECCGRAEHPYVWFCAGSGSVHHCQAVRGAGVEDQPQLHLAVVTSSGHQLQAVFEWKALSTALQEKAALCGFFHRTVAFVWHRPLCPEPSCQAGIRVNRPECRPQHCSSDVDPCCFAERLPCTPTTAGSILLACFFQFSFIGTG